jgi:hypothetical protein
MSSAFRDIMPCSQLMSMDIQCYIPEGGMFIVMEIFITLVEIGLLHCICECSCLICVISEKRK